MNVIKIISGVICFMLGSYFVLYEVAVSVSEKYLLRDTKLRNFVILVVIVGIALIVLGLKLILSTRKKRSKPLP
jgi:hypothetical protein